MRITDVKLYPVAPDLGKVAPEGLAESRVAWLFVVIETDEGISGLGESTNWLRKGNVLVGKAIETMKASLIGQDPSHVEKLWTQLYRNYTYLGSRGPITTAISGIDIALWDIKGKALGKPIYDLLGGPVRDNIPLYTHPAHPLRATAQDLANSGKELVALGFAALKVDPFRSEMVRYHTAYVGGQISRRGERQGVEKMAALRGAVGPDIELLVDLHGHYNVATAIRCISALQPYDVTWFEEPVPPEGFDALRQIREQTDASLCVGERLYTRWDFLPVFQNRLANYIMPDVVWTGGISELKKIAIMAEAFFVPVSPHQANGPVQIIAGAHTMMTVPNFYRLEIFSRQAPVFDAVIDAPLDIRNGVLYLCDRPGLGIELNMDYVKAHRDPDWT